MHIIDQRPFGNGANAGHRRLHGDPEIWSVPVTAQRGRMWRFAGVFRKILVKIGEYWRYRATIKELSTLTDYELADIGLHRGQLHDPARLWVMDASGVRSIAGHGSR